MTGERGIDRGVIEARLATLDEVLSHLEPLASTRLDEYRSDVVKRSAIERLLCRLVEAAAEINGHISARVLGRAPSDYYDSFLRAAEAGALEQSFASRIARSAGLRNRLVHQYDHVDHETVLDSLPVALDDYRCYVGDVLRFIDASGGSDARW